MQHDRDICLATIWKRRGVKSRQMNQMTTLFVLVDEESGKKFVQWVMRIEAEGTIGDGMYELPKGKPFQGIPSEEERLSIEIYMPSKVSVAGVERNLRRHKITSVTSYLF